MEEKPTQQAREEFAGLLNDVQHRGKFVRITRSGRTAGFLVPPEFEAQILALEAQAASGS